MDPNQQHTHKHTHEQYSVAKLQSHVSKYHEGDFGDVGVAVEHNHDSKHKVDWNYASRIDFHPTALKILEEQDPRVVLFGIEGCLKADSMLDAIKRSGASASVISVPAVGMWNCPELPVVVERYLRGRTVVIVPDADWNKERHGLKPVEHQARVFQGKLVNMGLRVHIAAPPLDKKGKPLPVWNPRKGVEEELKGVDDFLGIGDGLLHELVCIDREQPKGVYGWLERTGHFTLEQKQGGLNNQIKRMVNVVRQIALYAGEDGRLALPYMTMGKVMGVSHVQVIRDIQTLQEAGAVEVVGRLEIEKGMFGLDWRKRPVITIHPDLRSKERPPTTLGALPGVAEHLGKPVRWSEWVR